MNKFRTPTFNNIIELLLEDIFPDGKTKHKNFDVNTIKKNIMLVKNETEKLGFKWQTNSKFYSHEIEYFDLYLCNKYLHKGSFIVAKKEFSNGYACLLQMNAHRGVDLAPITISIEYPDLNIFLKPDDPLRNYNIYDSVSKLSIHNLDVEQFDLILRQKFKSMNEYNPKTKETYIGYKFVLSRGWDFYINLIKPIEDISNLIYREITLKDLKRVYDIIEKGIPYNMWTYPAPLPYNSSTTFPPLKGARLEDVIGFMDKMGMRTSTVNKLKLKYKISIEPKNIKTSDLFELV